MTQLKKFEIALKDKREEYYAGEIIQGDVVLDLCDSLLLKNFNITFAGQISCRFGRRGKRERLGDDNIYHFTDAHRSGYNTFCDEEITLVKELEDPLIEEVVVESGEKYYPFRFRLHPLYPSTYHEKWGHVIYELRATIESTGDLRQDLDLPITIIGIVDANRPIYKEGFSGSAYKSFGLLPCFSSSSLEVSGRVDRVCYLPGDTILIDAQVENSTNKRLKCLKAKLIKKSRYHYKKKTLIEEKMVAKVVSSSIPKGGRLVWKQEPFLVPKTPANLYCELIEVKYELRLQVNHITAAIPIVIGTIPHKSHQNSHEHNSDLQLPDTSISSRPNGKISDSLRLITNDVNRPLIEEAGEMDAADGEAQLNRSSTY